MPGDGNGVHVDFSFSFYRKTFLFLKKPYGIGIPKDFKWRCVCGTLNSGSSSTEQYCPHCGTRMRIQENIGEEQERWTAVRVCHFYMPRAESTQTNEVQKPSP